MQSGAIVRRRKPIPLPATVPGGQPVPRAASVPLWINGSATASVGSRLGDATNASTGEVARTVTKLAERASRLKVGPGLAEGMDLGRW